MTAWQMLAQADALGRGIAAVLLLMSVVSWALMAWKAWLLHRARRSVEQGLAVFWQSPNLPAAAQRLAALDAERVLLPLVQAALEALPGQSPPPAGAAATLERATETGPRLVRRLRGALHGVLQRLRLGQVLLASVGATAPFLGLLGTVWGIYHALTGLADQQTVALAQVAGPVGEALVMTAVGLGVAIPAVLGYNLLGRRIAQLEAELEGFAHDLCAWLAPGADPGR